MMSDATHTMISIGTLRGLLTAVLLLAFIAMVVCVYSKRNRSTYQRAACLPLEEDIDGSATLERGSECR